MVARWGGLGPMGRDRVGGTDRQGRSGQARVPETLEVRSFERDHRVGGTDRQIPVSLAPTPLRALPSSFHSLDTRKCHTMQFPENQAIVLRRLRKPS